MPTISIAELPARVTLSYAHQGDAAGTPMLLLHGVTDSWRSFEPVLPHLPASIRAVAMTQRGHGDSGRPATGYRTRDYADDIAAFVEALGLGPVVVVGHSMGATNAQRFAVDHPELTRALVLVASFPTYRDNATVTDLWESTVARLTDPVDPRFVREFQEGTVARPVAPAFLDMVVGESLKVPARVWRASFEGFLEDDLAGELGRIRAPTLVIWGDRDVLCPRRSQDMLLSEIAGSRLVVYEGAGHAVHWEEPQRFAADLTAFVRATAT
jgi:non-heme chloroperoxidase